jgi:hypothetical protein
VYSEGKNSFWKGGTSACMFKRQLTPGSRQADAHQPTYRPSSQHVTLVRFQEISALAPQPTSPQRPTMPGHQHRPSGGAMRSCWPAAHSESTSRGAGPAKLSGRGISAGQRSATRSDRASRWNRRGRSRTTWRGAGSSRHRSSGTLGGRGCQVVASRARSALRHGWRRRNSAWTRIRRTSTVCKSRQFRCSR